jgi:hypothetical protein
MNSYGYFQQYYSFCRFILSIEKKSMSFGLCIASTSSGLALIGLHVDNLKYSARHINMTQYFYSFP